MTAQRETERVHSDAFERTPEDAYVTLHRNEVVAMSQWKRFVLSAVAIVACTVAVVLLVTLTAGTTAGVRAGTSPPAVQQQAHPPAEPVPDDGVVTSTHIFRNVTQRFPFTNPCSGAPGTATFTFSGVMQVTSLPGAATFQVSGNETGSGVLAPGDPTQPSYSGHFASRFDSTTTPDTGTATTTLTMHGVGSDGSQRNFHLVQLVTMSATGMIVAFDHLSCA